MAFTKYRVTITSPMDIHKADNYQCHRSYYGNHLCRSTDSIRASMLQPKLKNSRSIGLFNTRLTLKSIVPYSAMNKEMDMEENFKDSEIDNGKKRADWIERLLELKNSWKDKQEGDEGFVDSKKEICDDGGCEVYYDEEENERDTSIDRETFSSFLRHVPWRDSKIFSKFAFLCNMAYVIPYIKIEDLRRYYGMEFVTSSLEKMVEAQTIKDKVEQDCTQVPKPSVTYVIRASAASYIQSRDKSLTNPPLSEDGLALHHDRDIHIDENKSPSSIIYESEMETYVTASTITATVLQSSSCEWFVCDDSSSYTRFFIIRGPESLAYWQTNLFFEPTKFEGTDVLVHRGIYEAAKGVYDQLMPEIKQHINRYGELAKLRFTGHSVGGSLALLVNLMLLARKEVDKYAHLPVVTFGSPFVFCGAEEVLEMLNLDDSHIHNVIMHRDIVPRVFSCEYPNYVARLLKSLSSAFGSNPHLNKNKHLYSPMGKLFILQPDEKSSPPHPLLPPGTGLYALECPDDMDNSLMTKSSVVRAFLNSPHPIETLSNPTAYGSEGTISRDHDSSSYLKTINEVIRHTRSFVRKIRKQRNQMWPLLNSRSPHAWSHTGGGSNNNADNNNVNGQKLAKEIMNDA